MSTPFEESFAKLQDLQERIKNAMDCL